MTRSPTVSVVTPFYNTEAYLAECIESVLGQDYQDWEYLLVDNQSTDRSLEIAESYANQDQRIRLLRTSRFLSQLENYNFALSQISKESRYCKIVQADDWIFPQCIRQLVDVAEANPTVAVVSSYSLEGAEVKGAGLPYPSHRVSGREVCRLHLIQGRFLFGTPTTVLYRTEVVNGRSPFLREDRLHADTDAAFDILRQHDFGFVHQVLSFLREDEASITGRTWSFGPAILDKYIAVKRYGHTYLDADEYRRVSKQIGRAYSLLLGRAALKGREAEFWDYHRTGLATVGEKLTLARILRSAIRAAFQLAVHPLKTARLVGEQITRGGQPDGA